MQRTALRMLYFLFGVSLAAAQPGPPAYECSMSDFAGKYAFHADGYDMRATPPSPVSFGGAIEADGKGLITAWNDWVILAGDPGPLRVVVPNDLVASAASVGSQIEYEVTPNCQMRIFGMIMGPAGPFPIELLGGLANGGRKAMLQLGSPVFIGTWTAESAEPERNGAATRRLLERVARRLSILP